MARIKLNNSLTINDAIENFLFYKMTQGVTEQTIDYYKSSFQKIFKHLNTNENLSALTQKDLQSVITEMRKSNLTTNSIACYVRALRVFLSWAKKEGLCNITIQRYKTEETVKETYTDAELTALLKKPNLKTCRFTNEVRAYICDILTNNVTKNYDIPNKGKESLSV